MLKEIAREHVGAVRAGCCGERCICCERPQIAACTFRISEGKDLLFKERRGVGSLSRDRCWDWRWSRRGFWFFYCGFLWRRLNGRLFFCGGHFCFGNVCHFASCFRYLWELGIREYERGCEQSDGEQCDEEAHSYSIGRRMTRALLARGACAISGGC